MKIARAQELNRIGMGMTLGKEIKFAIVINGNPGFRDDLQGELQKHGIRTLKAAKGQQAFELLAPEKQTLDLLICDMQLPDFNGLQILSSIRAHQMHGKCLGVFTVESQLIDNIPKSVPLNASGFIQKPFANKAFVSYLEELLDAQKFYQDHKDALPQLMLAKYHEAKKMFAEARKIYEAAIEIAEHPPTLFKLAKATYFAGDAPGSAKIFARALKAAPILQIPIATFLKEHPLGAGSTTREKNKWAFGDDAFHLFGQTSSKMGRPPYRQNQIQTAILALSIFSERSIVRDILRRVGVKEIHSFDNAQDAIKEAENREADLLLFDLKLPDLGGKEILLALTANPEGGLRNTRGFAIHDEGDSPKIHSFLRDGLDGHRVRPFSAFEIGDAIDRMMVVLAMATASKANRCIAAAALTLFAEGHYEVVAKLIQPLLKLDPDDPTANFLQGTLEHQDGNIDESAAYYRSAILSLPSYSVAIELHSRLINRALNLEVEKKAERDRIAQMLANEAETQRLQENRRKEEERLKQLELKNQSELGDRRDATRMQNLAMQFGQTENPESDIEFAEPDPNVEFDDIDAPENPFLLEQDTFSGDPTVSFSVNQDLSLLSQVAENPALASEDFDVIFDSVLEVEVPAKRPQRIKNADVVPYQIIPTEQTADAREIHEKFVRKIDSDNDENEDLAIDQVLEFALPPQELALIAPPQKLARKDQKESEEDKTSGSEDIKRLREMVFTAMASSAKDDKSSRQDRGELPVLEWLSPNELSLNISQSDSAVSASANNESNKSDSRWRKMQTVSEQAILLNGRITIDLENNLGSEDVQKYLRETAQVFAQMTNLLDTADIDKATGKLIASQFKKMQKNPEDQKILLDTGKLLFKSGIIEGIFNNSLECIQQKNGKPRPDSGIVDLISNAILNQLQNGGNIADWKALTYKGNDKSDVNRPGFSIEVLQGLTGQPLASKIAEAFQGLNGSRLAEDIISSNGVKVVAQVVKSGGGVRMLEQVVRSGFGDLLLQRLLSEGEPKSLFNFLAKLDGPANLLTSVLPEGIQDLREIDSPKECKKILNAILDAKLGDRLIAQIVQDKQSSAFIENFIKKDGSISILAKGLTDGIEPSLPDPDILLNSVTQLSSSVAGLHKAFWDGKQESRLTFKKVIQRYVKDHDEKRLKAGLEQNLKDDHMSLQAFKSIYAELFKSNLKAEAMAFFNQFYHLYCKHEQMRDSLASFLKECDATSHSQVVLETGAQAHRKDYYYAKELAVNALKQKDYKAVRRWCLRMIAINPRIGEAYNLLGISLKKQGKVSKAIREYKKGTLRDPTNTKILHNLAIAYAAIGKNRDSLAAYRKAHQISKLEDGEANADQLKTSA
jgi:CheY-like chemotaxis protein